MGTCFSWKNHVGASSWNQVFGALPSRFEGFSHLFMFGVKDPRSRRALKRDVRYLTNSPQLMKFVMRKCPEQTCSWTGGRTHECLSEFVSLAHTRAWAQAAIRGVQSDAVKRHKAHTAEDVEMDLTGADTADDEFPEEPHVEEVRVPREIPQSCVFTRTCVALCELVERTRSRFERRMNSSVTFCAENKPPKSHLPSKLADTYTEFGQGVEVDLFVLADSNEQVLEFLNIVDLATRFNICFPSAIQKAG